MKMACWRKALIPIIGMLQVSAHATELKLAESQEQLTFLNSGEWTTGAVRGRSALILEVPGEQRPPVRRPSEFALVNETTLISEFTIEAASLMPNEIVNRDICLIFGYQDDTHFYYAHVSSNSDNKFHNVIMRVDGDSRKRINLEPGPEARLSNDWKTIKVQHLKSGQISVFVDDMKIPNMTAMDATYPPGKIGFGSFDDRAAFSTLTY